MTSDVMVSLLQEVIVRVTTRSVLRRTQLQPGEEKPMTRNLALALTALVSFTAFTAYCGVAEGPLGFLSLALTHEWGMQMFLDVGISLVVASFFIVPDAQKWGINPWPYLAACLGLGSIAALAYLVHRELRVARGASERRQLA